MICFKGHLLNSQVTRLGRVGGSINLKKSNARLINIHRALCSLCLYIYCVHIIHFLHYEIIEVPSNSNQQCPEHNLSETCLVFPRVTQAAYWVFGNQPEILLDLKLANQYSNLGTKGAKLGIQTMEVLCCDIKL